MQLDELFALLSAVKDGAVRERQAIKRLSHAPHWGWSAMDPGDKLLLALDVGERPLAMAQRLVPQGARVLALHGAPLFLTAGLGDYLPALGPHYGHWMPPARRRDKGPQPQPRWMPLPGLLYAQVVKRDQRRRIVGGKHRAVFGSAATIESLLAKRGWKINTALAERLKLACRQHVAALGRRGNTLCKHEAGLRPPLALFHTSHNFVLPHASWRWPLAERDAVAKTGALQRWQPRPPAMEAGLTERVWSVREGLMYRVPPWPQRSVQ